MEKIEPSPKAHKVMLNYHKTKPNCLVNEIVVKSLELSTIQTFCPRNQHQNSLFSKYVKLRQNTIMPLKCFYNSNKVKHIMPVFVLLAVFQCQCSNSAQGTCSYGLPKKSTKRKRKPQSIHMKCAVSVLKWMVIYTICLDYFLTCSGFNKCQQKKICLE